MIVHLQCLVLRSKFALCLNCDTQSRKHKQIQSQTQRDNTGITLTEKQIRVHYERCKKLAVVQSIQRQEEGFPMSNFDCSYCNEKIPLRRVTYCGICEGVLHSGDVWCMNSYGKCPVCKNDYYQRRLATNNYK